MKTYYVTIEDCQNNPMALVKVKASSEEAAKVKALKALHVDDQLSTLNKEEALEYAEETGMFIIDEDGFEVED